MLLPQYIVVGTIVIALVSFLSLYTGMDGEVIGLE